MVSEVISLFVLILVLVVIVVIALAGYWVYNKIPGLPKFTNPFAGAFNFLKKRIELVNPKTDAEKKALTHETPEEKTKRLKDLADQVQKNDSLNGFLKNLDSYIPNINPGSSLIPDFGDNLSSQAVEVPITKDEQKKLKDILTKGQ